MSFFLALRHPMALREEYQELETELGCELR